MDAWYALKQGETPFENSCMDARLGIAVLRGDFNEIATLIRSDVLCLFAVSSDQKEETISTFCVIGLCLALPIYSLVFKLMLGISLEFQIFVEPGPYGNRYTFGLEVSQL